MHIKIPLKIFLFLLSRSLFATEVYFSPSTDCEDRIVKAINESKTEVVASVYSINNKKIVEALYNAKKRNVKVRVLTDRVQASQKSSLVFAMIESGLDVKVHSKYKIEHNKFGVYDGKLISTGSFNWTGPAARSNSENCIFLNDAPIIAKYKERFEFLWQKNTQDGSNAYLAKLQRKLRTVNSKEEE